VIPCDPVHTGESPQPHGASSHPPRPRRPRNVQDPPNVIALHSTAEHRFDAEHDGAALRRRLRPIHATESPAASARGTKAPPQPRRPSPVGRIRRAVCCGSKIRGSGSKRSGAPRKGQGESSVRRCKRRSPPRGRGSKAPWKARLSSALNRRSATTSRALDGRT
jgi:hypothetical protein